MLSTTLSTDTPDFRFIGSGLQNRHTSLALEFFRFFFGDFG